MSSVAIGSNHLVFLQLPRNFNRFNGILTRLTGNDMRVWLCIASFHVLDGIIEDDHLNIWKKTSMACFRKVY